MDSAAAGEEIWRCVAELFFSAENQMRFMGAADELGLTPPMLKALLDLEPDEGLPMRDLAESWGIDASFVTVLVDGLEERGYARRQVAPHDRRMKTVELTDDGIAVRERAMEEVYGPRAGFWALTGDEQVTLARLLRKLTDAQVAHDRRLLEDGTGRRVPRLSGGGRAMARSGSGARGHLPGLQAHVEELRRLRKELAQMRDELKAQVRQPVDDVKAAKDAAKAEVAAVKDELKSQLQRRAGR